VPGRDRRRSERLRTVRSGGDRVGAAQHRMIACDSLDPADSGLTIVTYSAEPDSSSDAALRDLEQWSATRAKLAPVGADASA